MEEEKEQLVRVLKRNKLVTIMSLEEWKRTFNKLDPNQVTFKYEQFEVSYPKDAEIDESV